MIILGIETSCDDTGISIYDSSLGILNEYIYNQKIHYLYGGTVPEIASKYHFKKIFKLILLTLKIKKILLKDLDLISYTVGPGLKNSLFVGVLVGKSIATFLRIPSIGINHLKAHVFISFLFNKKINFPSAVLFLSGAHSFFLEMLSFNEFNILGKTLDDSIGETFDKIARILNIIPQNGVGIEIFSKKDFSFKNLNYPKSLHNNINDFNFSFSGIKSYISRDFILNKLTLNKCNVAYNFQNTLFKMICFKFIKLVVTKKIKSLILAGGVSSNKNLRVLLYNYCYLFNVDFCTQPTKYCTDNGSMIAFSGIINFSEHRFDRSLSLFIKSNIEI